MTAPSTDSLVPLRAGGDGPPVYCVHPVSGSPYCYTDLASRLDAGTPVFGFEAPGFDGFDEPAGSIRELAEVHTATLRAARPHGPYRLLGWSLGGVVAFEMARLLAAEGEEVPLLVVIDAALPGTQPFPPGPALVRYFLHDFLGLVSGGAPSWTGRWRSSTRRRARRSGWRPSRSRGPYRRSSTRSSCWSGSPSSGPMPTRWWTM